MLKAVRGLLEHLLQFWDALLWGVQHKTQEATTVVLTGKRNQSYHTIVITMTTTLIIRIMRVMLEQSLIYIAQFTECKQTMHKACQSYTHTSTATPSYHRLLPTQTTTSIWRAHARPVH